MEIIINGITKNVCDFTTDILTTEKNRIEKKISNMEYIDADEMRTYVIISDELERRSE